MNRDSELRSVTLRRTYDAPIELVFRAWTEAAHVAQWMKCDREATLELERWTPAVGVEFRTRMWLEGVFDAEGSGVFTAVEPPRLLAYTLHADESLGTPEMHVRVELASVSGRTELTLTHSGIPSEELCGIIEGGWTNSLGLLGEVAATASEEVRT